jgi:uncharacterized protein (TIGR02217 family)
MSTAVFIPPVGTGWPITRTPVWDTIVQQSISGKEVRIAKQTYPRWKYELVISILRSSAAYSSTEFQYVVGFFNSRQGMFDTFLYQDADDNSVTSQALGTGDGTTTVFQFVRAFGGFIEPVLAPNTGGTINVYLNGVLQSGSSYAVNGWGTGSSNGPGSLVFNSAPGSGVVITADFSYYWPCRMQTDSVDFSLFLSGMYENKKLSFISVKN